MQSALHLLHAGGGTALAARRRSCSPTTRSSGWCAIAVARLGVTQIRLTGGEPTLRPGLPGLVERLAALEPRPEISLTTNGLGLRRLAPALAAAGLDRVNVSLDTLRAERFAELTRGIGCTTCLRGSKRRPRPA